MNNDYDFFNTMPDRKRKTFYKAAIVFLFLIFFSAVAVFSVINENRKSSWTHYSNTSGTKSDYTDETVVIKTPEIYTFPVYIAGEIANPGIYYIDNKAYIYELIEMAGGFTEFAVTENIDMVMEITDNKTIRIPSKNDTSKSENNNGIIVGEKNSGNENSGMININKASSAQLESLPGIGPVIADAIISYRNSNGSFSSREEIMNVPGIKESKFFAIKDKISVE